MRRLDHSFETHRGLALAAILALALGAGTARADGPASIAPPASFAADSGAAPICEVPPTPTAPVVRSHRLPAPMRSPGVALNTRGYNYGGPTTVSPHLLQFEAKRR